MVKVAVKSCLLFIFLLMYDFAFAAAASFEYYQKNVIFNFYYQNQIVHQSTSLTENLSNIPGCSVGQPWLILVHGFTQSCADQWVTDAVSNFTVYRGGCITCMDYSKFSGQNTYDLLFAYLSLSAKFEGLAELLTAKLNQFSSQQFSFDFGYMFAQSFGSQLILEAGKRINGQLKGIDACEPAGPLFYPSTIYFNKSTEPDYMAAQNVQCIHTSGTFGTLQRDCDQDWLMGECGLNQKESNNIIWGDHSACPIFYNAAFRINFTAVDNVCCFSKRRANLTDLPAAYKMGYNQRDKGIVHRKDLFSLTFRNYPYNRP